MREDLKLRPTYDGFLFLAESVRNPPALRSHHHRELELNLVARGEVTYVYGQRRMTFGPRSLLWMFPSQEHRLVNRSADAQYFVAVFKPEMIRQACRGNTYHDLRRKRLEGDSILSADLLPDDFIFLRKTMERIMEGSLDPDTLNREAGFGVASDFQYQHADPDALNAGLRHLLVCAWKLQRAATEPARSFALHPAVQKALFLLGDDQWQGVLRDLAKSCGMSESHLSRLFAHQVGVPLTRYRNSLRLSRFWEHYRSAGRPTILEAVFAAGFGSYAQFYKVFVASYGQGPRNALRRD